MSTSTFRLLQNQIRIIQQLNHPNLLKFLDVYFTRNNCYIVTELCEGGTLQTLIDKKSPIDWLDLVLQVAQGMKYLFQKKIIHRDIKPSNIFLKNGLWKIGDFGFAIQIPEVNSQLKQKYTIGSPLYMPIETLQSCTYSLKTDSFAFGVLIYYLLTKQYPWYGVTKSILLKNYKSQSPQSQQISQFQRSSGRTDRRTSSYEQKQKNQHFPMQLLDSVAGSPPAEYSMDEPSHAGRLCNIYKLLLCELRANQPHNVVLFQLAMRLTWAIVFQCHWNEEATFEQKVASLLQIQKPFDFGLNQIQKLMLHLRECFQNLLPFEDPLSMVVRQKTLQMMWLIDSLFSNQQKQFVTALTSVDLVEDFSGGSYSQQKITQLRQLFKI